ncbi:MAG TPA: Uma2 family endonuclease [Pirellulaceae bacterium]|nr:Uma2 family endonuclease [Pirellulaceae bacterium]
MSTVPKRLLTEQEYLAKERQAPFRSEFSRGEMFAMAGATREHNLITGNVARNLANQLDGRPCETYSTDMRVRITPTGLYTYPDVVVACGSPQFADNEQDVLLNPTVLIEVLSPSTASYDRGDKRVHYLQLDSLRELLLVEQEFPAVEHHIRQPNGDWIERQIEGPEARIELPSIGCVLTFAEIYARITFPPDARRPLRPMVDE